MRKTSEERAAASGLCLLMAGWAVTVLLTSGGARGEDARAPQLSAGPDAEPILKGKFEPSWESLGQYECPDWYRDAKLGI
jgi:hypothetical protein